MLQQNVGFSIVISIEVDLLSVKIEDVPIYVLGPRFCKFLKECPRCEITILAARQNDEIAL